MTTTTEPIDVRVRQLADDAVTMTTNAPKSVVIGSHTLHTVDRGCVGQVHM
jgi:hypothetical protein